MANGSIYDTWYDKAYPDYYNPDENETVECDNCGKDIPIDLDCLGGVLFYRIPGQKECYCKKCFPQVLASAEFHRECEVTSDNYHRRKI